MLCVPICSAGDMVMNRWGYLRDRYRRLKKQNSQAPSGSVRQEADVRMHKWSLFPLIDTFMRSHTSHRHQKCCSSVISTSNIVITVHIFFLLKLLINLMMMYVHMHGIKRSAVFQTVLFCWPFQITVLPETRRSDWCMNLTRALLGLVRPL